MRATNYILAILLAWPLWTFAGTQQENIDNSESVLNQKRYENELNLLPLEPNSAPTRIYLLMRLGKRNEALEYAGKVLSDASTKPELARAIFNRLSSISDVSSGARDIMMKYISNHKEAAFATNYNLKVTLALLDYRCGYTNALSKLALEMNENGHQDKDLALIIYQEMVMKAFQRKEYNAALKAYDVLFQADIDARINPTYMTQWAIISANNGQLLEALKMLDEVEKLNPQLADSRKAWIANTRGHIFLQLNDYTKAIVEYGVISNLAKTGNGVAQNFYLSTSNDAGYAATRQLAYKKILEPTESSPRTRISILIMMALPTVIALFFILGRNIKRKHSGNLPIIMMAILLCHVNCSFAQLHLSPQTNSMEVNFNDVYSPTNLDYTTSLTLKSTEVIESIQVPCPCTTIDLKSGDTIVNGFTLAMHIKPEDNQPDGAYIQKVVITSKSGMMLIVSLKYNFHPRNHHQPTALVFNHMNETREALFYFRDKEDVRIAIDSSSTNVFAIREVGRFRNNIKVEFSLKKQYDQNYIGNVLFSTTSKESPSVKVPYLVLVNNQ